MNSAPLETARVVPTVTRSCAAAGDSLRFNFSPHAGRGKKRYFKFPQNR